MLKRRSAALFILPFIAACSGALDNGGYATGRGHGSMYPISAEEADRAMASAMLEDFPSLPIASVGLPHKGYMATIGSLLHSHLISLVAIPATGVDAGGTRIRGFTFEVTHRGTMPIAGASRAASVLDRAKHHAAAFRGQLPALRIDDEIDIRPPWFIPRRPFF